MITILVGLLLTAGADPEPRQCQIDVAMTKPDLTAPRSEQVRDRVIAEPRVVTHFGRPAYFRAGGAQAILGVPSGITGPGVSEPVSGVEVEVTPTPMPFGRIRLEMRVTPAGGERGPRFVTELKSGAKYRFRGPDGLWIEVTAAARPAEK